MTGIGGKEGAIQAISIHTSAREVTDYDPMKLMSDINFNPHFRKGSDEDFLQIVDSIAGSEMSFRYEVERERGYQIVKSAINEAKELGGFGERRIALENLLDILSEVGLFLSIEQINIADRAFGIPKNMNEEILIDYYKKNLVKN